MTLKRDVTNVYTIDHEGAWPEELDPFVLYNVRYNFEPWGEGYYSTDGTSLVPLASASWVARTLGVNAYWKWDDSSKVGTGLAAGQIRSNEASIQNATKLYVHDTDVPGQNRGVGMRDFFEAGDLILITNVDRAGLTMFRLTDPPYVDQTDYLELNVAFFEGGKQNPSTDDLINLQWFDSSPDPTPA